MNLLELIPSIAKYLSRLSEHTKLLNAVGDFSINKYAETALVDVFSIVFDCDLKNANTKVNINFPAIDLIDNKKKFGIQITATSKVDKINKSITRYFEHEIYNSIEEMYVFILTERQSKYDQTKIDIKINNLKTHSVNFDKNKSFSFNAKEKILDKIDLIQLIENLELTKINEINNILKNQFDKIQANSSLKKYYTTLKDSFFEVVLNDTKGMTLIDIYVEPYFSIYCNSVKTLKKTKINDDSFYDIDTKYSIHHFFNEFYLKNNVTEEIHSNNITLILGYPGQGKTSFCKKLVYDYLNSEIHPNKNLYYFRLKDIRQAKNLVNNPLSILYDEGELMVEEEINKHEFRKSLLILDGLDELFMKEDLRLDDIERFCKELIRESEKFQHLKIIITSRNGYVELDKLANEAITIIKLKPFDESLQIEWVNKYKRFHNDSWLSTSKIKEYNNKKGGSHKEYIRELIEQPLLLHILASLKNEISPQSNRTKLYDQLFTELIQRRYSNAGQIEVLKDINQEDLRELIQEIAFAIYQTGNGYISRKDLIQLEPVQKYLSKLPNSDFKESIKGIMVSFYFKESTKVDEDISGDSNFIIEFLHKSLQEYMVAEKLVNTILWAFRNKDLKGNYILDNKFQVLKLLNELFSNRPLSWEIETYIEDILETQNFELREDVADRIALFLEFICEKDFLCIFDSNNSKNPLEKALNCFNSTWLFLTNLSPKRNFLISSSIKDKISNYIHISANTFIASSYQKISFQDLSNIDLISVWGLGENDIISVNFRKSRLLRSSFIDSNILNCNFNNITGYSLEFADCDIKNCSFIGADCTDWNLANVVFENVNFSNSYIDRWIMDNVSFKKMKSTAFKNIDISLDMLQKLLQIGVTINLECIKSVYRSRPYEEIPIEIVRQILEKDSLI